MKTTLLITLLILSVLHAKADIVFVDLNNAPAEIETARQAAKARGEKLIVLPLEYTRYKDATREKINKKIEVLEIQERQICASNPNGRECEKASELVRQQQDLMDKLPVPIYTVKELKTDLSRLQGPVTSVLLSGHDGNASISGEFGKVSADEFVAAFREFKGRTQVQSVYLLGCRSAVAETFAEVWQVAFPRAVFIAGYENIGYLRDNPMGSRFLKSVMQEEPNIIASKTMAEAQSLFRRASPVDHRHGVAASLSKQGQETIYLSSNNPPELLRKKLNCPETDFQKILSYRECAIERGGSDCPLSVARQMIPPQRCQFLLEEKTSDITRLRNEIYVLDALGKPTSHIYSSALYENLYAHVKNTLQLTEEDFSTYPKIKASLAKVKQEYERLFSYASLKNLSPIGIAELGRQKEYFDNAWLAISNLEVSKLGFRMSGTLGLGGELRAQAFVKALKSGQIKESFADRIAVLQQQKSSETSEAGLAALKAEITALENFRNL